MGYVYNDMERLRFWCQKVLPTVYDDSLSYYELLCKVVQYLNDTVENVNTLIQQVADIDADLSNVAIIQDSGMSTEYVWSSSYTNTKMNDKIHNSIINIRSDGSTGATYSCKYLTDNFASKSDVNAKISSSEKGVANGVASLGSNGKVPDGQLPSGMVNTIEGIKVNGSTVNPDADKIVNLVVMTNAVDNLLNYYTKTQTYSKSEVDTIASNIRNSRFEVVNALPTTGIQTNVIYLVPKTSAGTQNGYNEYINLDGTTSGWELIGSTDIDLSGYVTTTDLNNALSNYVTTLTLTGILNNYITVSELAIELASYATVGAMNTALAGKQNTLTFDNFPTAGSTNPVTSGGVKSATTEIWGVIGTIEAGLTSTHAYEVGDYIICWIGFAEVIAPIAVGDTLERNVNVVEGTIASTITQNAKDAFPRNEQSVLGAVNLLDVDANTSTQFEKNASGQMTNHTTDTVSTLDFAIQGRKNGTFVKYLVGSQSGHNYISSTGKYEFKFTIEDSDDINQLYIGHKGNTNNVMMAIPFTHKGTFYFSANFVGVNPSTQNGYTMANNMVALSSNAPYAPYAMPNRELTEKVAFEDITNSFYSEVATGFIIYDANVAKCGKHILGDICIGTSSSITVDSFVELLTLTYPYFRPASNYFNVSTGSTRYGDSEIKSALARITTVKKLEVETHNSGQLYIHIHLDYYTS